MTKLLTDVLRIARSRRAVLAATVLALVSALAMLAGGAAAQQGPKQVQLTAKQIEQYIASYKELTPLYGELDAAGDNPSPKLLATIETVVKKYGFANLDEYDSVVISMTAVTNGIDPDSKQYSDPIAATKEQIASVRNDKSMSAADRKEAIEELNAALAELQPVEFPSNIPLVVKYYDRLAALPQ
jgi:hypothetical protein